MLFKPWPGRLQCLIGHLAENEIRGELTFLEKAKGISVLRSLYEEEQGNKLSLRAFARCMTADGLPVSISHISKMEDTVSVLLPYMPRLLEDGLGRHQIEALLSLRSTLKKITLLFLNIHLNILMQNSWLVVLMIPAVILMSRITLFWKILLMNLLVSYYVNARYPDLTTTDGCLS